MSCGGEKLWSCGSTTSVNFQGMGYLVGDIGHPCLSQSSMKVGKRLKPAKWRASFDSDGKVLGFHKALRSMIHGGIDPSIRPEVWEFLLGCYTLDSTAEFRQQLREARRERYNDLIRKCHSMNANVGTGSLAHVVGSKVMDIRTTSKDDRARESNFGSVQASTDYTSEMDKANIQKGDCKANPKREMSTTSGDLINVRNNCDGDACDTAPSIPSFGEDISNFGDIRREANGSQDVTESYVDIPSLPVANLFEKSEEDRKEYHEADNNVCTGQSVKTVDDRMHCFRINNNADLVIESNGSLSDSVSHPISSEIEMVLSDACGKELRCHCAFNKSEVIDNLKISSIPESPLREATSCGEGAAYNEERVSEWLWTLHQIVVDVVRTDSHLEFYGETRNLARMADILAVYAWVDPATGYCQGMSDLLSPFVVLYEDDADAFWCFEMLLRRMRENFQLEGPTGVMKQLEALRHILELTNREMFAHLSLIGAESLHFAFRMLLVLFRRELTFHEALCMWEMIWAADFDDCKLCCLEKNCLELLEINFSRHSSADSIDSIENGSDSSESHTQSKQVENYMPDHAGVKSAAHPFCGLTTTFWSRNDHLPICNLFTRRGHDELPVYCVAAILTINRQKIIRETHSIDDLIKIFNDNVLKIDVRRCVSTAIKLRKKYFYKIMARVEVKKSCNILDLLRIVNQAAFPDAILFYLKQLIKKNSMTSRTGKYGLAESSGLIFQLQLKQQIGPVEKDPESVFPFDLNMRVHHPLFFGMSLPTTTYSLYT